MLLFFFKNNNYFQQKQWPFEIIHFICQMWDSRSKVYLHLTACYALFQEEQVLLAVKRTQQNSYFSKVQRKCRANAGGAAYDHDQMFATRLRVNPSCCPPRLSWDSASIHSQWPPSGSIPSEDTDGPIRSSDEDATTFSLSVSISRRNKGLIAPQRKEMGAGLSTDAAALAQPLGNPSARTHSPGGPGWDQEMPPIILALLPGMAAPGKRPKRPRRSDTAPFPTRPVTQINSSWWRITIKAPS